MEAAGCCDVPQKINSQGPPEVAKKHYQDSCLKFSILKFLQIKLFLKIYPFGVNKTM